MSGLEGRPQETGALAHDVPRSERAQAGRSDAELVAALVEGDEAALAEIYDRYAGALYRAAMLRVGDRQLAEEILQDTYLALWNRAELFDPRAGSLIGWLSTIARNRAIDRLRASGRRPSPLPLSALQPGSDSGVPADGEIPAGRPLETTSAADDASTDPAALIDVAWLNGEVERALAQIPENEREVIRLAYYEDLSQSEIAVRLAWPLGTVKTRTRRALGRLRGVLAGVRGHDDGSV